MASGRTVAVVALLVLAGCGGFDGGSETVTPAPVPTAGGETTTDATAIADRHRRVLADQSYTARVGLTVEYENGTTARSKRRDTTVSSGRSRSERGRTTPRAASP